MVQLKQYIELTTKQKINRLKKDFVNAPIYFFTTRDGFYGDLKKFRKDWDALFKDWDFMVKHKYNNYKPECRASQHPVFNFMKELEYYELMDLVKRYESYMMTLLNDNDYTKLERLEILLWIQRTSDIKDTSFLDPLIEELKYGLEDK